jgi:hypothetical protein
VVLLLRILYILKDILRGSSRILNMLQVMVFFPRKRRRSIKQLQNLPSRLATRGPIYGGIIVAHIVAALGLSIAPNDTLLVPQRLDLAAMKIHHFVTTNSCAGKLVYRMLFTDGDEREVPLLQPSLFSICRRPWPRLKEELDEQLRLLGFHIQQGVVDHEEEEVPADHYTMYHTGAPLSLYQDEGTSLSYFGDAISWPHWD